MCSCHAYTPTYTHTYTQEGVYTWTGCIILNKPIQIVGGGAWITIRELSICVCMYVCSIKADINCGWWCLDKCV